MKVARPRRRKTAEIWKPGPEIWKPGQMAEIWKPGQRESRDHGFR